MAFSGAIKSQGSLPLASVKSRSAIACSARYRPARKMQSVSPTRSAMTVPSASSRSRAVRIRSCDISRSFFGKRNQSVSRQAAMPLVHSFGQRIGNAGAHADHGGLVDAELHRDSVSGLEANAADIAGQTIGIFGHDLDGIGAVRLVDTYRPCSADAMAVQEHHDLAHHLLLGPGSRDASCSYGTNAIYLLEAVGFRLNDIEHRVAEGTQELLGIDRTYAADHSRGEVFLDALVRGGR